MWAKLSNVLKPRVAHEDPPEPSSSSQTSHDNVLSKVFDQHPNLSVFRGSSEHISSPSPPPSPTRSMKRNMFKRLSKAPLREDSDSTRAPSPMIGQPKKIKAPFSGNNNNSQASLSKVSNEPVRSAPIRRSSFDMLRPSKDEGARQTSTISAGTIVMRRPSLDMLRSNNPVTDASPSNGPSPMTPSGDVHFGSVRSILRDPKTPGTGQNVRFFSRDAYKVISPDQSMEAQSVETDFQSVPQSFDGPSSASSQRPSDKFPASPPFSGTFPVTRASSPKVARPTVAEVFSPLSSADTPPVKEAKDQAQFIESTNALPRIPPPEFDDIFNVSQTLDFPHIPPGLGFEVPEPTLDSGVDMSLTDDGHGNSGPSSAYTSTPYKDKGKGKATDVPADVTPDKASTPTALDETIFHSQEKSSGIPSGVHDRSHSFSLGQTAFQSLRTNTPTAAASSPDSSFAFSSTNLKKSLFDKDAPESHASQSRSRALSDTVFQSMIQSPPNVINDESSQDIVMIQPNAPEQPDPFRANATTYYTPQTLIPITPPPGAPRHARKTSKEDSIIFSLQTQLALQTELCQQYENDLLSRDELVEILGKKLSDVEKEDVKRRSILRTWKKKVQELEKTCRYLEDEVEGSRQSSMERSIMDEASGEALRMLHRQISVLEREKSEWMKKEQVLREEVETLEKLVKERCDDVQQLKKSLWTRDESERMLKTGIRETKEQMEQLGSSSCVIDDRELQKMLVEHQAKNEEEQKMHRLAEFNWDEERGRLTDQVHHLEAEKSDLEANLENKALQLHTRDEEFNVLKAELDAQWEHSEKASEKFAELEVKVAGLESERDALHHDIDKLRETIVNMETIRDDNESKKVDLKAQLQEVWDHKEELEKEKIQLEDQLQQEREHSEGLARTLQEYENRISQLDQERQFSQENVGRLEEKLRQRDEEDTGYSEQAMQREAEVEELREEMTKLCQEHTHATDELERALQDVSTREGEARAQLENLVRQQVTVDIEMKTSLDKVAALKEEVERQRRKIQVLQQESADKEVKLVQLNKQHQRDKEDLEGMNTALDSKQMELELIKRNLGVRGTGGATPAPASRAAISRRDSSVFSTPSISRPPSTTSDAGSTVGKDRTRTSVATPASAIKISALGKSVRPNGTASTITASKRVEGSMGPPPKARSSLTPTSAPRVSSLSRSSSAKPATPSSVVSVQRRIASLDKGQPQSKTKTTLRQTIQSPISSLSEQDEKENVDVTSKNQKRRSLLPAPA
ncbi:hypothetical protein H0H87_009005 [Tephrocybe sp. NHM501043]|nr:hypothetical protein H0H87_009005 [Tephrocybe sp. NHM501043]